MGRAAPRQVSKKELDRCRNTKPIHQRKFEATYTRYCPSCSLLIQKGTWITRHQGVLVHETCAPATPQFVIGKSLAEKRSKAKKRKIMMKRVLSVTQIDVKPTHGRVKYDEYIQSSAWALRKNQWYSAHGKWCRGCESEELIHLHHKTYRHLGHEPDEDLVALCSMCHMYVHHLEKGEGKTLKTATELVVIF